METESSFLVGLFWGVTFSIPLWISFLGWIRLLIQLTTHI